LNYIRRSHSGPGGLLCRPCQHIVQERRACFVLLHDLVHAPAGHGTGGPPSHAPSQAC